MYSCCTDVWVLKVEIQSVGLDTRPSFSSVQISTYPTIHGGAVYFVVSFCTLCRAMDAARHGRNVLLHYEWNYQKITLLRETTSHSRRITSCFTHIILSLAKLKLGLLAHVIASVRASFLLLYLLKRIWNLNTNKEVSHSRVCILIHRSEGLLHRETPPGGCGRTWLTRVYPAAGCLQCSCRLNLGTAGHDKDPEWHIVVDFYC